MGILNRLTGGSEESKQSGGMSEEMSFEMDTQHANFQSAEWDGTVAEPTELEEEPETVGETVELGKFKNDETVIELPQDTINVTPRQAREWDGFTSEEVEELTKPENRFTEEELSSAERVEKALESPEYPNSRSELWHELAKEEGRFGLGGEQELSEAEAEREFIDRLDGDIDPTHPENKKVQDMTGGEFASMIQKSVNPEEEEELSEDSEAEEAEEETVIETPDSQIAQLAARDFDEYGGIFSEIAEELAAESKIEDTRIESIGDGVKKITTQNGELKEELARLHVKDGCRTRILDKDGETLVAEAYREDIQNGI
jgi:hypothetical protein